MDDLFRFITIRPPQKVEPAIVSLALPTILQEQLENERRGENSWPRIEEIATQFTETSEYVTKPSDLWFGEELVELRRRLLAAGQDSTPADVASEVQAIFHIPLAELGALSDFRAVMARVYDSVLATYISPPAHRGSLVLLVEFVQTLGLLDRVYSRDDPAINEPGAVAAALNATLLLPEWLCNVHPTRPRPVGVADLLVVKQHLKGYELGEIARIENVLQGETRKLTRKHKLSTEQITVTELEQITEEEKELEIKERFALKREAENTLKEDTSVKSGVSLTAKYGDSLQVNANVNVDYSNAKSEATKMASEYAKDVTSRAASKVTERIREQITRRVLETFEETDEEGFDNKGGQGNVVGVYQWVNKVYEAQVFNYGKRLLFDIMVPEPAAFLWDAVTITEKSAQPKEPLAFTAKGRDTEPLILPSDLALYSTNPSTNQPDDYYFGHFVARYNVTNVDAPPLDHITVSQAFAIKGKNDNFDDYVDKAALTIPEGYEAITAQVQGTVNHKESSQAAELAGLRIMVGNQIFLFDNRNPRPNAQPLLLEGRTHATSLPVAIQTYGVTDASATVDILCKLTDAALDAWKVKTHAAILQAYNKLKADYEDKLAAQAFQQSSRPIIGGNPDQNRRIERTELKKACIALLIEGSGRDLLSFDGIEDTPPLNDKNKYPRPNPARAQDEGKSIRFFEQAFEWEHMMYHFYPYFWGRKETWYEQVVRQNDDPVFLDFLRAGAARVVVPVRPTFDADVKYYLCTDQIWRGGDLPGVTDKTYLPITEEIKEATGAPGTEKPQGEPWEIRIPTSLIKLRRDGMLPKWARPDPQKWEWISVPEDA